MNTITTVLTTKTICSDDGSKRYLLKKTWDKEKPKLTIIMLAPSSAADIELDSSTMLVLNNAYRLNFGSVAFQLCLLFYHRFCRSGKRICD